jgi:Mlc titration factor MtfA (ptsG expression regulator)
MHDDVAYDRWAKVMSQEYAALVQESEHGHATVLNHYGATNAGEFFAVATEAFFEKPRQMRKRHERLYGVLRDYYCPDPAARVDAAVHARALDRNDEE